MTRTIEVSLFIIGHCVRYSSIFLLVTNMFKVIISFRTSSFQRGKGLSTFPYEAIKLLTSEVRYMAHTNVNLIIRVIYTNKSSKAWFNEAPSCSKGLVQNVSKIAFDVSPNFYWLLHKFAISISNNIGVIFFFFFCENKDCFFLNNFR